MAARLGALQPSERPSLAFAKDYFACLADPVTTAAGRRWFAGTRTPCRPSLLPLYDFKHPRTLIAEHQRVSMTPDNGWCGRTGGARRDRTDDLMLAKHALSQLSYDPF